MLWIGAADIKDLYVKSGKGKNAFLAIIGRLIRREVEIRHIHAKETDPNFREDYDRNIGLYDCLERIICPRILFNMLIVECREVYIGGADLAGAGIDMNEE